MKKLTETNHAMKMMWACVAFAVLAIVLVASGVGAGAFFILGCVLMLGAMMWMMGDMGGSRRGGNQA